MKYLHDKGRKKIKLFQLVHLFVFIIMATILMTPIPHSRSLHSAVLTQGITIKANNIHLGRNQHAVFIQPLFTQAAYGDNDPLHGGFYDYYFKKCDQKCLTVPIPKIYNGSFVSSGEANESLIKEHYAHVTDVDVDKDPAILEKYHTVIVLHNEYVTKREFDAITHHPHVIYLYPNALFAQVRVDYNKNTITLVRGHWYPDSKIANGFGWKYDNTKFETDTSCTDPYFYHIDNGEMLNCYPEYVISSSPNLLETMMQFII